MLGQRRSRWNNITVSLDQCPMGSWEEITGMITNFIDAKRYGTDPTLNESGNWRSKVGNVAI